MSEELMKKLNEDSSFRKRFNEIKNSGISANEIMQEIYNKYPAVQALSYINAIEDNQKELRVAKSDFYILKRSTEKKKRELEEAKKNKERYEQNIADKKQRNGKAKSYQDLLDEINAEHPFLEKEILEINHEFEEKELEFEIKKEELNKLIDIYTQERNYALAGNRDAVRIDVGESIDNRVYTILDNEFGAKPQGITRRKTTTQRMSEVEKKKFRIPKWAKITGLAGLIFIAGVYIIKNCVNFDIKPKLNVRRSVNLPPMVREKQKSEIEKIIEAYDKPPFEFEPFKGQLKIQQNDPSILRLMGITVRSYNPITKELELLGPYSGSKKLKPIEKPQIITPDIWGEFDNKDIYLLPGKMPGSDMLLYYNQKTLTLFSLDLVNEYFIKGTMHPNLKKDFDKVELVFSNKIATEEMVEKGFYTTQRIQISDQLTKFTPETSVICYLVLTKNNKTFEKPYTIKR